MRALSQTIRSGSMMSYEKTGYWSVFEVIKLADEKYLTPYGLVTLGASLSRLEWALAAMAPYPQGLSEYLATFLQPLLILSLVRPFAV